MLHRNLKEARGFTLIELLVVIAIIGLLASIILASLSTARVKARDARRISDIDQLRTAIELYASDHNDTYPPAPSVNTASLTTDLSVLAPKYIPSIPKDPSRPDTRAQGYLYCTDASQTGYVLLVFSEKTGKYCGLMSGGADVCGWSTLAVPCQ
jgi:prepilin-type N-terminal cleavage/methylation domain-containing protein